MRQPGPIVALWFCLTAGGMSQVQDTFLLEVPALGLRIAGNMTARLPHGNVTHFRIHIQRQPGQVNYGSIFARINTQSANVIMTTRSTATGLACDFDLTRRDGFRLKPGRNSVEVEIQDVRGRLQYASFLLDASVGAEEDAAQDPSGVPLVSPSGARRAVVIGVSRHRFAQEGIRNLAFADRDATAVRDFLLSPEGGSFRPDNLVLLLNEDATLERVRTALFNFLAPAGRDDVVVIYFNGHGAPDPDDPRRYYFLPHDGHPDDLAGTALPFSALEDLYGRVLKTQWVVTLADASRGGAFSRQTSGAGNNLVHQYLMRYATAGGGTALAAANVGEVSWEADTFGGGHGAFTHFLLRGLRGEADRNRDGTVTLGEARAHVRDQVRRATGGQQTPFGVQGPGDGLALAGLRSRGPAAAR